MSEQRLVPVPMSAEALLAIIDNIRELVASGDSFEGYLNYLIPDPEDDADFAVEARYRIGNLQGQGGMRIIGTWVVIGEKDGPPGRPS